jgi:hypothetical protein
MLTIAALITPLTLATAPMAITNEEQAKYSHEQQVIVSMNNEPIYQTTYSGTQTFDTQGKPTDSDND